MTTVLNTIESVIEHLERLDNSELVSVNNVYCQNNNYSDNEIYSNDEEFFNMFFDGKVIEAVKAVSYGEYNFQDDYVIFNGYANLVSFNDPTDNVDMTEIANDILENPGNYDIELEEEETEEEAL